MRKSILFICMALLTFSCEKNPDYEKLDADLVVYTDYDKTSDFSEFKTFYLPDSILEVNGGHKVEYWKDENAQKLIQEVNEEMKDRGYVRISNSADKSKADLGIQMSYIAKTNIVISGGYGFWDYGYWGPWWGGWFYPYTVGYSYNTNTLMIEIVDLTQKDASKEGKGNKLPVIWHSHSSGYQYNNMYNNQYLMRAIQQAFAQSPYIKSEK